jgi:hypothetical protein
MVCDRCKKELFSYRVSYFNTDTICNECVKVEEAHPDFERAKATECEAVRAGDFNFPGIGLPKDMRRVT